jgi:hypothetical protein
MSDVLMKAQSLSDIYVLEGLNLTPIKAIEILPLHVHAECLCVHPTSYWMGTWDSLWESTGIANIHFHDMVQITGLVHLTVGLDQKFSLHHKLKRKASKV